MNTVKRLFYAALAAALTLSAAAADVSITGLPAISSVASSTIVPVVDMSGSPTTKKATVAQLINGLPLATTGSVGTMSAADKLALTNATAVNTASTLVLRDGSGNFAANAITAAQVTGLSAPTLTSDAATKAYVDSVASGLNIKNPAVAATTANVTLAGGAPTVVDGRTLIANDRVLVKNQTTGTENGIYYVSTLGTGANGTWTRTTDADTGAKLVTGSYVFVTAGSTQASNSYVMVTPGTIVLGTSTITWNLFSTIGNIQASSIVGQIVNAQIADAALTTAKFAASIQPVSIVSALPSPSGYTGPRAVFDTSDGKLYRYDGAAFTVAVATADLTGTITTTQIADNAITTPKLLANSVVAGKIAANAVVAGDIAANAVTAGTIAAAAVSTTELAASAVTSAKIAAGTIVASNIAALTITGANIAAGTVTADKMNVSSLSAITANIGTITNGSLTSSASISVGSGTTAVNISSGSFSVGVMAITDFSGIGTQIKFTSGSHVSGMYATTGGAEVIANNTGTGDQAIMFDTGLIRTTYRVESDVYANKGANAPPALFDGTHNIAFRYDGTADTIIGKVDATDFVLQRAGSYTSSPGIIASGYITMKDASGTTRNFLVQ